MKNAPGLQRAKRRDGTYVYYWRAANVSKAATDYPMKTVRLHGDEEAIAARCRVLTAELREWLDGQDRSAFYDGTIASLIDCYQRDEDSPYRQVKANTRRDYDVSLSLLRKHVGAKRIDLLTGRDLRRWYNAFKEPAREGGPGRIRRAHGCMKLLRTIVKYGRSMRYAGCGDLVAILSDMRFGQGEQRDARMTYEQALSIVETALERDRRSIALAQALQFETTLRQKDVIGEWLPDSDNLVTNSLSGGIVSHGSRWANGLLWSDLDDDLILRKRTTKTGSVVEFTLTEYPLVMRALEAVPAAERVGPMIVSEATGRPYRQNHFGKEWRKLATAAGVPRDVWNMDSRAGGLSEAASAGADIEDIRRHAGHTDAAMTRRYTRENRPATERVARLRVKRRASHDA